MSRKNNSSKYQIQFPLFGRLYILEHFKEVDAITSGLHISIVSKRGHNFQRKQNNFRVIVYWPSDQIIYSFLNHQFLKETTYIEMKGF